MLFYILTHFYRIYSEKCGSCETKTTNCSLSACEVLEKITTEETPVSSRCERRSVPTNDVKLNDLMARYEYIVIGRNGCPWCQKAMAMLQSKNKSVEYLGLEDYPVLYSNLSSFLNYDYVPIIIHKGAFIGGYTELLNCLTQETLTVIETKTNEKQPPVKMPPPESYTNIALSEPKQLSRCETKLPCITTAFKDVQVGPTNANRVIDAMNINQQANLLLSAQQNQQQICQLEKQKRNATVEAQQKANDAQQKLQEAQQASACATQTAQNATQQQQELQEQQNQVTQAIENTIAQQQAIAKQKTDCEIAKQVNMAAQNVAEINKNVPAAQTVMAVQPVPVVQGAPVIGTTNILPTAVLPATTCNPDASNPLRMGEPQNIQSQLVVQPLPVTSSC